MMEKKTMHPMRMERFLKNISLDELSMKTGIDQAKLSRIERGYKIPRDEEKTKIANALGVKVEAIFYEVKNNERNRGLRNSGHSS